MSIFKKAVKSDAKLRMAITGPSGSGKTYSALAIASALVPNAKIAVVDTENGSAAKYADQFDFDVAEMHAPFAPAKYVQAIQAAEEAGYDVIILDSLSHAWSGTGGVIDIVDNAAKRMKNPNTYMAWKEGTPEHNRLIDGIVQSRIHVIGTMRAKTEYIVDDRNRPRKVGMAPVQRDQFEYEFDIVFDMDVENNAIVSKTRCPALANQVFPKPGVDVAGIIANWLRGDGKPEPKPAAQRQPARKAQPEPQPESKPQQTNGHNPFQDDGDRDVDFGMGGKSEPNDAPWYAEARALLQNGVAKFADAALGYHRDGGPASERQYQYLVGLLNSIIKDATGADDGHKRVLSVLCQADISSSNPPSKTLATRLLDKLATHKKQGDEKVENPAYDQSVVDACIAIYRAAEAVATPTLFAVA